jgi:hypothetical protein
VRAAVVIKLVAGDSLRKTGIFAIKAGDFQQFAPQDRRTSSPGDEIEYAKCRIFPAILAFLGKLGRTYECLAGAEGSNPRLVLFFSLAISRRTTGRLNVSIAVSTLTCGCGLEFSRRAPKW